VTSGLPKGEDQGPILVLYHANRSPLRASVRDHLYSFSRYSGRPCVYVNLAVRSLPNLESLGVQAVVFHTLLLAQRWHPPTFRRLVRRLQPLRGLDCHKVAIPQDDYIHTTALRDFIRDFAVDRVLSCAPESEWRTIYGDLADGPARFTRVLPGYLEPATLRRIARLQPYAGERTIDIGYRAWRPDYSLGHHAQLKAQVGEAFASAAIERGLRADISLRDEDTILGDDWYRFMLRCRWMIGVEGGASLIDPDGSIRERTAAYRASHPDASFEEVEAACFPGLDGSINLVSISPRHLEACATGTAQVLVAGSYNGILEPELHYLPVRPDLADVPDVIERLRDEALRDRIAARAYADIVASGRFEYAAFVQESLAGIRASQTRIRGFTSRFALRWARSLDRPTWVWVWMRWRTRRAVRRVLERLGLLDRVLRVRAERSLRAEG
jgi:hypothetical protein